MRDAGPTTDGHVLVTFASLHDAAADVEAVATRIEEQLADLEQFVTPLLATWSGEASLDYRDVQTRWGSSATDLHVVLRQLAEILRSVARRYQAVHDANGALWEGSGRAALA